MLLSAEHISLNFGLKQLLEDVTLYLNEGDKIGIIGINGTGKSSLLRVLAGQQVPDQGTVSLDPNVQVCFLPQNPAMVEGATVLEQVFHDFSPDTRALLEYEAKAMLTRLGITDFTQPVDTLSGGQRKRVALATVLLHPADVLILPMTDDMGAAIALATSLRDAGIQLFGGAAGGADDQVLSFLGGNLHFSSEANCSHHESGECDGNISACGGHCH